MTTLGAAIRWFASHDAAAGALPSLYAAAAPEAVQLGYYGPQNMFELKGPPGPARVPQPARDETAAARLWAASEKLTGASFA